MPYERDYRRDEKSFSIAKAVVMAFLVTWANRKQVMRSLAIPLVCLVALKVSWFYLDEDKTLPNGAEWLLCFAYLVFYTFFAVICHRIVLLGPDSSQGWLPQWSWTQTRFLAWLIIAMVIYFGTALTSVQMIGLVAANILPRGSSPAAMQTVVFLLSAAPAFYVFGRLSLAFPAIAIGSRSGIKSVWERSRGNGWRLAVVVLGVPLLMSSFVNAVYREGASPFEGVFWTFVGTTLFAVEIAALSIAYRELSKDAPAEQLGRQAREKRERKP